MGGKEGITSRNSVDTNPRNYWTVSCKGLLICSALFSSNMLANPAIDCEREEIERCMINREGWQPRDACSFSPSPLFWPFPLAFLARRRVVRTGRPHRDPVDPLERDALWRHRGKKSTAIVLSWPTKKLHQPKSLEILPSTLLRPSRYFDSGCLSFGIASFPLDKSFISLDETMG